MQNALYGVWPSRKCTVPEISLSLFSVHREDELPHCLALLPRSRKNLYGNSMLHRLSAVQCPRNCSLLYVRRTLTATLYQEGQGCHEFVISFSGPAQGRQEFWGLMIHLGEPPPCQLVSLPGRTFPPLCSLVAALQPPYYVCREIVTSWPAVFWEFFLSLPTAEEHFPTLRHLPPPSGLSQLSKSQHRVNPKQETGAKLPIACAGTAKYSYRTAAEPSEGCCRRKDANMFFRTNCTSQFPCSMLLLTPC